LLGEPSSGCRYHGASGTSAEKRASRHVMARHGFAGAHRLSPFGVVESIAMTPNAPDAQAQRPAREQRERPARWSVMLGSRPSLLDDLIGPLQERLRDGESDRLRGLEVDNEVELRGLLDGQVGGLGPLRIRSTKSAVRLN
jgi:hypothetical protein